MNLVSDFDDAYERLANAVIVQAADDYKLALKQRDKGKIRMFENFFRGGWFAKLSRGSLDPEYIIDGIREKIYGFK